MSVDLGRKNKNRDIGDCMFANMPKYFMASETAGSVYVPKKKTKTTRKAHSQIDDDEVAVRSGTAMSFDGESQGSIKTKEEEGAGVSMKLQNVVFGPNGTVRMNNKAEDHRPGDPLLMMVVPGGGKLGVPEAEAADDLEESRKSVARVASQESLDSPDPIQKKKSEAPAPVKEPMVNRIDPNKILAMLGGKGGGGNGSIDPAEKRKIIQEIKSEMKPMIN